MELCSLLAISRSDGNQSASVVFNKMTALNSQKHPDSNRLFALRRLRGWSLIHFDFRVVGPYNGLLTNSTWDKCVVSAGGHCSGFINRHGPAVRVALLVGWAH